MLGFGNGLETGDPGCLTLDELDFAAWWRGLAIRDPCGQLAPTRDQNPGISPVRS
jgi:hypothetical protein